MPKVVIYVKESDWRQLQKEKRDPAEWVRGLVKAAFDKKMGRS